MRALWLALASLVLVAGDENDSGTKAEPVVPTKCRDGIQTCDPHHCLGGIAECCSDGSVCPGHTCDKCQCGDCGVGGHDADWNAAAQLTKCPGKADELIDAFCQPDLCLGGIAMCCPNTGKVCPGTSCEICNCADCDFTDARGETVSVKRARARGAGSYNDAARLSRCPGSNTHCDPDNCINGIAECCANGNACPGHTCDKCQCPFCNTTAIHRADFKKTKPTAAELDDDADAAADDAADDDEDGEAPAGDEGEEAADAHSDAIAAAAKALADAKAQAGRVAKALSAAQAALASAHKRAGLAVPAQPTPDSSAPLPNLGASAPAAAAPSTGAAFAAGAACAFASVALLAGLLAARRRSARARGESRGHLWGGVGAREGMGAAQGKASGLESAFLRMDD